MITVRKRQFETWALLTECRRPKAWQSEQPCPVNISLYKAQCLPGITNDSGCNSLYYGCLFGSHIIYYNSNYDKGWQRKTYINRYITSVDVKMVTYTWGNKLCQTMALCICRTLSTRRKMRYKFLGLYITSYGISDGMHTLILNATKKCWLVFKCNPALIHYLHLNVRQQTKVSISQ